MTRLYARFYMLIHDDKGATAIEYGLIAALVSVAIVGALTVLGDSLGGAFTYISTQLSNATGG